MTSPHHIYVGTIGEGVFRSIDSGETFKRAMDGGIFVESHVRALVVHPNDPRTLYLGSEQGLFRSGDGADSWSRIESPLNGLQVWSILVLPNDPELIVVGTCPSRLFVTWDAGRSWKEAAVPLRQECPRIIHTRVTCLAASGDGETLWAGIEIDGLCLSRDRGRTWQKVNAQGLSSQDIHALAVVPGSGGNIRLLAATNNDLNVSQDEGETWQPQQIGKWMPWSYCRSLAQPSGRPDIVLLGNGDGPPGFVGAIGRSTDGGLTWSPARMPGRANSTIWSFAVHPSDADLIYAASVSGQVYRSSDSGASWEKLAREFGEIRALAWTP